MLHFLISRAVFTCHELVEWSRHPNVGLKPDILSRINSLILPSLTVA